MADGDIVNHQIAHLPWGLAADINLCHRAETAHRKSFDDAVRSPHIEGDIVQAPTALPGYLTSLLQNKPPAPVAAHAPEYA